MNVIQSLVVLATTGLLSFVPSHTLAQNIAVAGGSVLIPDGSVTPTRLSLTDFGQVAVNNATKDHAIIAMNMDDQATLQLTGAITVSGPHAADFALDYDAGWQLGYLTLEVIHIVFNPSAPGVRNATITIPNNTPGSKEDYTFAVKGEGINGFGLATPDLDLAFIKIPKVKTNSKTGLTAVSWSLDVVNLGPGLAEGAVMKFYRSEDRFFSQDDEVIIEIPIKPLAPPVSGKNGLKYKKKRVKFKAKFPEAEGHLFGVVTSSPYDPAENVQDNNVVWSPYPNLGGA